MTRQTANRAIILKIAKYVEENPDQRFGQILRNVGAIVQVTKPTSPGVWNPPEWANGFNEESDVTLIRMNNTEKEKK